MSAACIGGHLHVVKYLIEDCRIDAAAKVLEDFAPLHVASHRGHLEIVQYLINDCRIDAT